MNLLNKIQQELKAPKGQRNSFGNYNYRSCEDIMEAVKPLLGIGVLVVSDEIVNIGERYYVKAKAQLNNGEDEDSANREWNCTAFAREPLTKKGMDEAQITGATSSYARKYALNGLFAIDDTKDADTMDNSKTNYPKSEQTIPAHAQAKPRMMGSGSGAKVYKRLEELKINPEQLEILYKKKVVDFTAKDSQDVLLKLSDPVKIAKLKAIKVESTVEEDLGIIEPPFKS
jgi:hypothetical protein